MSLGTRFVGSYEHSLDTKGRVILPAKLRQHFMPTGFLAPHLEGCLALWTQEEFDKESDTRLAASEVDAASRNEARDWASRVNEVSVDPQGRMPIPAGLRGYAGIEQDVLIVGMINRVELWCPSVWAAR
ncbi:MAG: division/cell wall cluster transcriptional repressor MraZ [Acidimicrobiales bacterium]